MGVPTQQENRGTPQGEKEVVAIIRKATKGRRHIIAARMGKILGIQINPRLFAEFCRTNTATPSKRRHTRFPAAWVKAFCEATGSDELARCLLPESARCALAASAGIVESRKAVTCAQEALGRVQTELGKLAEGNQRSKR